MITALTTASTIVQTQQELRLLLAKDKVEETINSLLNFSEVQNLSEIHDLTLQQAAKYKDFEKHQLANTLSFEQLGVMKSQVVASVIELINRLSEQEDIENAAEAPPKSVQEKTLKTHILLLLILSKLALFFWIQLHWESGGLSKDQFIGTLSLLIPVLASYSILAFRDLFKAKNEDERPKYFSRSVLIWSYPIIIGYTTLLFFAIELKALGSLDYTQMNSLLAVFESGFGVFVGQLVMDIFKKE